jgi:Family of unknown function (DUF6114)
VTAGDVWRSFGRWRHRRPFWGCFFFILSGAELFFSANQSLGGISLHLGPTGFLSYLLPLIMVICAVLCLITPAQRLFYGIIGLLAALYSFIGLNLGGFFIGMLLGIVGGALIIAWGPPRQKPVNPDFVPIADQIEEAASSDASEDATDPADAETEHVEIAGHDDRPTAERIRPSAAQEPGIVPGFDHDQESPKSGSTRSSRLSRNPKALTVALIVVGLTAGLLAVGSRMPASADDTCPAGLPSRTATATSTTAAAEKAAAGTARTSTATAKKAATATKTSTEASPSASPSKSGSGNKIVDGVQSIIDGVGNLLGLGDDPSSSPSASPSPSETPTTAEPTKTGDPEPTKTADPTTTASEEPTKSASASTSPSSDDVIPCLGARVLGLQANADGVPPITDKPGLLETDSLTMYDSTYDGVVNLTTGSGNSVRVLKFSMDKAVNKPFSLTIAGAGSSQTVITSNELATIGTVKFYTQRFEGKLFGLIPVVFTPDQPPPLTLPILWFTDVKIQLNYIRCDTLTGVPLHISQQD